MGEGIAPLPYAGILTRLLIFLLHFELCRTQDVKFTVEDISDDTISYLKMPQSLAQGGALLAIPDPSSKQWLSLSNDIFAGFSDELWQRYTAVGLSDFSHSWFKNFTLLQYLYYPTYGSLRVYNYTGAAPTMELQSADVFIDFPALSACSIISANPRVRTGWAIDEKLYCLNKSTSTWTVGDVRKPSIFFVQSAFQAPPQPPAAVSLVYPFGKFKFSEHPVALYTYYTLTDPKQDWKAQTDNWRLMFLLFDSDKETIIDTKPLLLAKGGLPDVKSETLGSLLRVYVDRRKVYHDKFLPIFFSFVNIPESQDPQPEVVVVVCNLQVDLYSGGPLLDIMGCAILTRSTGFVDLMMAEVRELEEDKLFVEVVIKRDQEFLPRTLTFNLTLDITQPPTKYFKNLVPLDEIVYPIAAGVSDVVSADLDPASLKFESSLFSRFIRTTYQTLSIVDYRTEAAQYLVYDSGSQYTFVDSVAGRPLGYSLRQGNVIYFSRTVAVKVDSNKDLAPVPQGETEAAGELKFFFKFLANSSVDVGALNSSVVSVRRGSGKLKYDPEQVKDGFSGYEIQGTAYGSTLLQLDGVPQKLEQTLSVSGGMWNFNFTNSSPGLRSRVVKPFKYLLLSSNNSNWTNIDTSKVWALRDFVVDPRAKVLLTCQEFAYHNKFGLHLLGCVQTWNFTTALSKIEANFTKSGRSVLYQDRWAGVFEYELPPKPSEDDTQKIRLLVILSLSSKSVTVQNLTNITGFSKGEFDIAGKFTHEGIYWFVSSDGGRLTSLYFHNNGTTVSTMISSNYKLYSTVTVFADSTQPEQTVSATFRTFQNRTTPNRTLLSKGKLVSSAFVQIAQGRVNTVEQLCQGTNITYVLSEYELWRHNQSSGEFRKLVGKERTGNMLYGVCLATENVARVRESTPREGNWGSAYTQSANFNRRDKEDVIIMGTRSMLVGSLGREESEIVETYVEGEDGRYAEVVSGGANLYFNSSVIDPTSVSDKDTTTKLELVVQGSNSANMNDNTVKFTIDLKMLQSKEVINPEFSLGALTFKKTAAYQALGTLPEFEAKLCTDTKYCQYHFWKFVASELPPKTDCELEVVHRLHLKNYTRASSKDGDKYQTVSSRGIDVLYESGQLVASLSGAYTPVAVLPYTGTTLIKLAGLDCQFSKEDASRIVCNLLVRAEFDDNLEQIRLYRLSVNTKPKFYGEFRESGRVGLVAKGVSKKVQIWRDLWAMHTRNGSIVVRSVSSENGAVAVLPDVNDFQFVEFCSKPDSTFIIVLHSMKQVGPKSFGIRVYQLQTSDLSQVTDVTTWFGDFGEYPLMKTISCLPTSANTENWRCIVGGQVMIAQIDLSTPKQLDGALAEELVSKRILLESDDLEDTTSEKLNLAADKPSKTFQKYKNWHTQKVVALPTGFLCLGHRLISTDSEPSKLSVGDFFDSTGILYYPYEGSTFASGGLHGLDLLATYNSSYNFDFAASLQIDYSTGEYKKDGRVSVSVSDLGRTFWLELREPSVILRAKTKNVTLPKSLDLRVVMMKANVGTSPLTYTSLSFDSNSNGEDPAPTTSKLFNIIMYGGAGFGCLMCMAVLMRYCTRSTELEKLEGDEADPTLLAPNRLGVKESVVSMGMDNTTSDNNSRL